MTLRRVLGPAVWTLRTYRGTVFLLVAAGAVGLAAALPVTSLVAPHAGHFATRLGVPVRAFEGDSLGMAWGPYALTPIAMRQWGVHMLFTLLAGVAIGVLVVAAMTVLSVASAQAAARAREIAVRRAVGASRRVLLATGLVEGAATGGAALLVGGIAGTLCARLALERWPGGLHPSSETWSVVAMALALVPILLGAMLPYLAVRHRAVRELTDRRLELIIPVLQLGLSLTVLTAGSLLLRRARELTVSPGTGAPSGELFTIAGGAPTPADRSAAYAALLGGLKREPHVRTASLTSPGALVGLGMNDVVAVEWGGYFFPEHHVFATHYLISADTFRTLHLPVLAGRGITTADDWDAPRVAVVSHALATNNFEGGQVVGRKIQVIRGTFEWYTVVGVVADQPAVALGAKLQPRDAVYLSVLQHPAPNLELLVRGDNAAHALPALPRGVVRTSQVSEASVIIAAEAAPLAWFGRMFGALGWVVLLLATLGTFVVMRLWVLALRYELGVRRAVGATRRAVLGFVVVRALAVGGLGILIGLWLGGMVWGGLAAAVAGLPAWDTGAALRFGALLAAATLAGALWPAQRLAWARPGDLVAAGE
ncbi:MAG TPA: FtsX-like permease family protein [Gemmatimonadales bacterium]|nr:FtsX-like permease family protein [Gemmatimonadales bacterium]